MAAVVRTTSCAASEAWIAGGAVRRCAGASRVLSAIAESTPSSLSSVICAAEAPARTRAWSAAIVASSACSTAPERARERSRRRARCSGPSTARSISLGGGFARCARDEPLRCEGGLAMWGSGAATARARCRRGGDLPESIAARRLGRPGKAGHASRGAPRCTGRAHVTVVDGSAVSRGARYSRALINDYGSDAEDRDEHGWQIYRLCMLEPSA